MSYVNLDEFPEANTGYRDGKIVWDQIYNENCFKGSIDDKCTEERVFYKIISGLHTSITTHICKFFEKSSGGQWKSNLELYKKLVHPHPDRIKNLYFLYLFMLR
jgi:ERO1-like protein alpha